MENSCTNSSSSKSFKGPSGVLLRVTGVLPSLMEESEKLGIKKGSK